MSKAARSGFKDRGLPFRLSSRSGGAGPVSFRFLDPRSAVVSLTVNVMDCRFQQIPIWLLTSWNLPHKMPRIQAQSSRGSQAPTPVPDTLFSGEKMTHWTFEKEWEEPLLRDRSSDREIFLLADFRLQTSWHWLAAMQMKQKSISLGLQNRVLTITLQTT